MAARYLFLDEVDGYPGDVDGEGDPTNLALARTRTFARRQGVPCLDAEDHRHVAVHHQARSPSQTTKRRLPRNGCRAYSSSISRISMRFSALSPTGS